MYNNAFFINLWNTRRQSKNHKVIFKIKLKIPTKYFVYPSAAVKTVNDDDSGYNCCDKQDHADHWQRSNQTAVQLKSKNWKVYLKKGSKDKRIFIEVSVLDTINRLNLVKTKMY